MPKSEGEFKRRVLDNLTGSVAFKEYERYYIARFQSIYDDMKKEFPYVDHKEWLDPMFLKEDYHYDGDITRVIAWFVKWFGDSDEWVDKGAP